MTFKSIKLLSRQVYNYWVVFVHVSRNLSVMLGRTDV